MLWYYLMLHKIEYLLTRQINQDCLENLFATVRNKFANSDHHLPTNFRLRLKTVLTNSLLQPPTSSNCQSDLTPFLNQLQLPDFSTDDASENIFTDLIAEDNEDIDDDLDDLELCSIDSIEENAITYVTGCICFKNFKFHKDCIVCKEALYSNDNFLDDQSKTCTHFKGATDNPDLLYGNWQLLNAHFVDESFIRKNMTKYITFNATAKHLLKSYFGNLGVPINLCKKEQSKRLVLIHVKMRIFVYMKKLNIEAKKDLDQREKMKNLR